MSELPPHETRAEWRHKLYRIIYLADTPAGKRFDLILILTIFLSIMTVMLNSVTHLGRDYGHYLSTAEWIFTGFFTIEYILRIICVRRPVKYIFSFFGIVDLLSILPSYLSVLFVGTNDFLVIRVLRILRIFRVLKLVKYISAANVLLRALLASREKIIVFLFGILTIIILFGSLMYLIEGPENGFTSIPRSIYWAIVTLTTVGYGDISPKTDLGQAVASVVMIMGYAIIAVPTGIITAELNRTIGEQQHRLNQRVCPTCSKQGHDREALYCDACGEEL